MNVLLIGLGQLGSRYLQGIVQIQEKIAITVVEPSDSSYRNGLDVLATVCDVEKLDFARSSIDSLNGHFDICILSTSAGPRPMLVKALVERVSIDWWILEKVLAQSEEGIELVCDLIGTSDTPIAWINTPRRRTSLYKKLKELLLVGEPIEFTVNIPELGIGCNSIHFIDVVGWLTDSALAGVKIISAEGWKDSKRLGYLEFEAQLTAFYDNGSKLRIDSESSSDSFISVSQCGKNFRIAEHEGIWVGDELIPGRVEFQSELSAKLVEDALKGSIGDSLPTLVESAHQHRVLFSAIRECEVLNKISLEELPIT